MPALRPVPALLAAALLAAAAPAIEAERTEATHGIDLGPAPASRATALTTRDPFCVEATPGDGQHYVQFIYAYPLDRPNLYAMTREDMLASLREANGYVHDAAVATGGSADIRVRCEDGAVHVAVAQIPKLAVQSHFQVIADGLRAQGFDDPRVKYLVYWDAWRCLGCRGEANIESDDRATVDNRNNGNSADSMFAISYWELTGDIFLHELSHTLGAVQHSAPHATWGWHCTDGSDVMCYADGTGAYNPNVCATHQYDCGKDDYFHANPAPGSYLATHWNLGATYHRYFEFA